jgi:membrane-associated phospholipid phosphatase
VLFAAAYVLYESSRTLEAGSASAALLNARRVFGVERALGIDIEASVQRALDGSTWMSVMNWVYLGAQALVFPLAVVLVYRLSRPVYRVLRNALLGGWILALPVYALLATAPPRLSGLGLDDTVSADTAIKLDSHATTIFYNPYAAMPSMHAAFAFAVGIAVAVAVPYLWVRIVALTWGPVVSLATVATGNHFVLDLIAGVVILVLGLAATTLVMRGWSAVHVRGLFAARGTG